MKNTSTILNQAVVAPLIKLRDADAHKGQHGHALLIAGSKGKMGAAVIAAKACVRSGAGLLTVNVPEEERQILQTAIPEAMLQMRETHSDFNRFSAAGIGPALGIDFEAKLLLETVFKNFHQPLLLDADALTILAANQPMWTAIPVETVITPHPGEFDRMFGKHQSIAERNAKAIALSLQYPWVIVLKGAQTQIAWKGNYYTNTTGNAGLAKGGSGDALSGMILSFLAQGYTAIDAAIIGVYLHGLAADIALQHQSVESLIVTDVIDCIGKAFNTTR